MSTEENNQEVEQHVEDVPENQEVAEEEVAEEEVAEEEVAEEEAAEEEAAQPGGDLIATEDQEVGEDASAEGDGDITDRRVFINEVRRIDETTLSIIRGLSVMTKTEDEELRANIVEVFADVQAEEAALFSPIPDYIADIIDQESQARAKRNKGVQPHDGIVQGEVFQLSGDYSEEHRAFVNPSQPLMLPYSLEREKKENPNRNPSSGAYHDLFFGDGSQCVFAPPEENKRREIEERQLANRVEPRPPVSYEPPPRKTMRVSGDFVPSCAEGTSPSQRDSANPVYRRSSGFAMRSSKPRNSAAAKPINQQ